MTRPPRHFQLRIPTRWFLLVALEAFLFGWLGAAILRGHWPMGHVAAGVVGALLVFVGSVRIACGAMHEWAVGQGAAFDYSRSHRDPRR